MTNGDRIRAMTDEELTAFLNDVTDCCSDGYICEKCPLNSVGEHCNIVGRYRDGEFTAIVTSTDSYTPGNEKEDSDDT